MFDSKLSVLKRKLFLFVKQSVNLFEITRKSAKEIAKGTDLVTSRRPICWKLNRSTYFFKSIEEKPAGKVFATIFRCLNFSVAAIISPYPKISKLCKIPVPPVMRDDCWKFSDADPVRELSRNSRVRDEAPPPKRKGSHARDFSALKSGDLEKVLSEWKEPSEKDLPPPQRCRLSCPLPPDEYILTEKGVPPQKVRPYSLLPKSDELRKPKSSLGPHSQRIVKNAKNYFNLKNFKANEYSPQVEIAPQMNALLFDPVSLTLTYDLVNAPTKIFKDEVLVQVFYSGVTGSDVFITEGKVSCGNDPVILGHEISGRIYMTGSDVHHVKKGDDVAINAYSPCCLCRYCSRGLFSSCENEGLNNAIGTVKHGGWAQFVVVKKSQVYKIPSPLGLDQAVLIQPLSCVLNALSKLDIMYGMDVFIQGLGLSGCLWAAVLHSRGHKNVIVTEKSEKKRAQFESLDLNYDLVPPEDIGKQSADVIVECSGSPLNMEKSFNIINPNGKLCFFGKPNPMTEVRCIPYDIIKKEVTIVGNSGNSLCFTEALDVARSMGDRYLDYDKLGVQTFDLKDFREAFQMKKSGEATKIVFKIEP